MVSALLDQMSRLPDGALTIEPGRQRPPGCAREGYGMDCVWDVPAQPGDVRCLRCGVVIDCRQAMPGTIKQAEKACALRLAIKRVGRPWRPGDQGQILE